MTRQEKNKLMADKLSDDFYATIPDGITKDALGLINAYGGIDGDHHKTWVLDQVVRILTGNKESYKAWVKQVKAGEDGLNTYSWDTGIAP